MTLLKHVIALIQLYMMAEGQCIYQGSIPGLIPYLSTMSLICPPYHNPADFGWWRFNVDEAMSFPLTSLTSSSSTPSSLTSTSSSSLSVIEVACGEFGDMVPKLAVAVKSGRCDRYLQHNYKMTNRVARHEATGGGGAGGGFIIGGSGDITTREGPEWCRQLEINGGHIKVMTMTMMMLGMPE